MDSTNVLQRCEQITSKSIWTIFIEKDWFDWTVQIATILIAVVGVYMAYRVYVLSKKDNEQTYEANRKIDMLRSLVLDHKMPQFYQFFNTISTLTEELSVNSAIKTKKSVNDKTLSEFSNIRLQFVEILKIIDDKILYFPIKEILDNLSDCLTETIFNQGINLKHQPTYREKIKMPIYEASVEIIKILFNYTGK